MDLKLRTQVHSASHTGAFSFAHRRMSKSPRACNIGPKDNIDAATFGELLLNYVDATVDDHAVFELYAYAGKKQGSGLDYNALALLEPLIRVFLTAAPSGYFKKTDVRHAMDYCLSRRPLRAIQPRLPKM